MVRASSAGRRSGKERAQRDYRRAVAEYRHLANYLKAAVKELSEPECDLLWEFAEISKGKCERLRRAVGRRSGKHRPAA